jgi:hypothetical protein
MKKKMQEMEEEARKLKEMQGSQNANLDKKREREWAVFHVPDFFKDSYAKKTFFFVHFDSCLMFFFIFVSLLFEDRLFRLSVSSIEISNIIEFWAFRASGTHVNLYSRTRRV